jgi:hypothetical protein
MRPPKPLGGPASRDGSLMSAWSGSRTVSRRAKIVDDRQRDDGEGAEQHSHAGLVRGERDAGQAGHHEEPDERQPEAEQAERVGRLAHAGPSLIDPGVDDSQLVLEAREAARVVV